MEAKLLRSVRQGQLPSRAFAQFSISQGPQKRGVSEFKTRCDLIFTRQGEKKPLARLSYEFEARYQLPKSGLSGDALQKLTRERCMHDFWPYFTLHVATSCGQLGLPAPDMSMPRA